MEQFRSYDPVELVLRGVESDELDYKAPMNWNTMSRTAKGKILRHLTAFANTRGGHLVIGVCENSSGVPDELTGLSEAEAASFDPTPVGNFINAHIEPPLDFTIDRPLVNGKRFVVFTVRQFATLPHICSKAVEGELQEGVFYIRTSEASSRPARRALELQELLRRCMRNEREQLGRVLRGILYETRDLTVNESRNRISDLVLDAERYFRRRRQEVANMVTLKFFIIPENILPPSTAEKRRMALAEAPFVRHDAVFLDEKSCLNGKTAANSLRMLAPDRPLMWQFFDSGTFICFAAVPRQELTLEKFCRFYAEAVAFSGNLMAELSGGDELLTLKAGVSAAPVPEIFYNQSRFTGNTAEVSSEISRSTADLISGRENHAVRLIRRLGENFQVPDSLLDQMEPAVKNFLARR
ncbi:MAG: ATP-binding protein [Lentisphaeria bacterium]|nr:ATP-binding protein [Lentisphaeria bacterium]